jgi:hypothetical protein
MAKSTILGQFLVLLEIVYGGKVNKKNKCGKKFIVNI